MTSSREDSPDWLRSFQAPTVTLSSDSDPLPTNSPSSDYKIDSQSPEPDSNDDGDTGAQSPSNKIRKASGKGKKSVELPEKKMNMKTKKKKDKIQADRSDGQVSEEAPSEKPVEVDEANSVWTLSSDSESSPNRSLKLEKKIRHVKRSGTDKIGVVGGRSEGSPPKKTLKEKSPNKLLKDGGSALKKENSKDDGLEETGNHVDFDVADEETTEKHTNGASSRIPLVLSEKVNRTKALVECDGESVDLSGDVGAVGRVVIPNTSSGDHEMFFDLKGTIYRTTIIPSRTFCIVSFGQSEAKIEAIMNDFIQLKAHSNVYEAETMVEGTLEGFYFDSEDEAEKIPKAGPQQTDQNDEIEEKSNGKTKRKAEKLSAKAQKKGRSGGKPQPAKKATKKSQGLKKARTKK